ncbi:MAG: hypothetical protein ACRELC_07575 [Gemmatimonadota bacterium]
MKTNGAEKRIPLSLMDEAVERARTDHDGDEADLRRSERNLKSVASELAAALQHLERALLVAKGTGFSGRVRELFDEVDTLQREASREFGRKVGDRLGRETQWRVQRGVEVE